MLTGTWLIIMRQHKMPKNVKVNVQPYPAVCFGILEADFVGFVLVGAPAEKLNTLAMRMDQNIAVLVRNHKHSVR